MNGDDNPFDQVPELQPALLKAAEVVRTVFDALGLDLTLLVIAFEADHENFGEHPLRTAVSWPEGEQRAAADLARESVTVLQMAAASRDARGQG